MTWWVPSSAILISVMKVRASQSNLWSYTLKMKELKVHIPHVMWDFNNNKNATEIAKKICSVYGKRVIIDLQVRNWFSKFRFNDTSLRDEPSPGRSSDLDQNALRELVECNLQSTQELSLDFNIFQSAIYCHWKKIAKVRKPDVWFPNTLSEKNKDRISTPTNLLSRRRMTCSSRISLQVTKNGSFITIFSKIHPRKNIGFRLVIFTLSTIFIRPCTEWFSSFSFSTKCSQ